MSEALPPPELNPPEGNSITTIETRLIISRDLADLGQPGVWVEVDPDLAEEMGAFEETAVTAAEAEEAEYGD